MTPRRLLSLLACGPLSAMAGCSVGSMDPVHDAQVAALGPEEAFAEPGPMHRPGQPCTVCHGPEGPAHTPFVLAGTVFAAPDQPAGLARADVIFVDALGSSPPPGSVVTNCAGNFYVLPDLWNPAFPVLVAVASGASGAQMVSHIGRAGSCASCHKDPRGIDSPGRVFVQTGGATAASTGCAAGTAEGP